MQQADIAIAVGTEEDRVLVVRGRGVDVKALVQAADADRGPQPIIAGGLEPVRFLHQAQQRVGHLLGAERTAPAEDVAQQVRILRIHAPADLGMGRGRRRDEAVAATAQLAQQSNKRVFGHRRVLRQWGEEGERLQSAALSAVPVSIVERRADAGTAALLAGFQHPERGGPGPEGDVSHPGYAWTVRPAPGSGWQWRIVRAGDGVACGEGRTATRAAAAALVVRALCQGMTVADQPQDRLAA